MTRNVDGIDVLQTWLSDFQLHADMLAYVYYVNELTERISCQIHNLCRGTAPMV